MSSPTPPSPRLNRRDLLKQLGVMPFLLRAETLFGEVRRGIVTDERHSVDGPAFSIDGRYLPTYPVRSPLEDVLGRVLPGSDEFASEGSAAEIEAAFNGWGRALVAGRFSDLAGLLLPSVQYGFFHPAAEEKLRDHCGVETWRASFAGGLEHGAEGLMNSLRQRLGAAARPRSALFEITDISVADGPPRTAETSVRYSLVLPGEQRVGTWSMLWKQDGPGAWRIERWQPRSEQRALVHGEGFVDVTQEALGRTASYAQQMMLGADEWRSVLDGASGIDVYGNNGVAAGDYNNDGFDDLYVSQPAGLPNRLYRNLGDGTFEDVTEKAGVGLLDNTACAVFADFRNAGLQDLLVVCGTGPVLFENQGDGTFRKKANAFQFAQAPQGTFTHAAVADYDGDGRLDVYLCVYSYYLGLDQYHYPAPYYDARNGPPNFLFHNQGDGTFADRTEGAGLNADNDRYSFACAWGEGSASHHPDLYVVNDFGRNNLYRNQGDGTFRSAAGEAHVEDVGAGMSAAWGDFDNDGRSDLYVANMWSAAGQRVSRDAAFHREAPPHIRELYQRHARGNALYRNVDDSGFRNVSEAAGAEVGRWAWCSDFIDFDQDGLLDLYITNGYITAAGGSPEAGETQAERALREIDLASFFWRQVVAKSPEDGTPSPAYEHGWNALNELMRTDNSWNGNERNVLLANNGNGTFSEISGALGLDCLEDSRSFALADLDGDGRLEIVLKNRNAPQLRILRNAMTGIGGSISFLLQGTRSNRDAIGAAISLTVGTRRQTRFLQAGSGFLAQHTKQLHFGLGDGTEPVQATVRWPSGLTQTFANLPRNCRIHLTEGSDAFRSEAFRTGSAYRAVQAAAPAAASLPAGTWLLDPLPAPAFSLKDAAGSTRTLASLLGHTTLLCFWSLSSAASVEQLRSLDRSRAALISASVTAVAVNLDRADRSAEVRALLDREHLRLPVLLATEEVAGVYNIIFRYLFDRRRNLGYPTSFLLDAKGSIVKVYQGPVQAQQAVADARAIPSTAAERIGKALPFPGVIHDAAFTRNDFTYGVAMFQHGYLDEAAQSFQQVVSARPDNAEGFYNLGTLNLRRNRLDEAQAALQQTVTLRPVYPEAWNNMGMLAAQQGRADEAIRSFRKSLEQRPGYVTALLNLGNLYRRQRNYPEAQELLQRAVSLQPDDAEANYSLGMLYAQQGRVEDASAALQRALALRPGYAEALNNFGILTIRKGDYAKAEDLFRTCIRLNRTFADAYLNLARLYVLQQDRAKAKSTLEDLLREDPQNSTGRQALEALGAAP